MHTFLAIKLVEAVIGSISDRNWNSLPDLFAPDATWWNSGNPALLPPDFPCGEGLAQDRLKHLPSLLNQFDNYEYNIINIVGHDNKVMVEAQEIGRGPGELVYINNITSSFEVEHRRKITKVREYADNDEIVWVLNWLKNHSGGDGCPLFT